ncbi:HAD family hydrolase [Heyndrickxia sporothermodurans]|uniref:HAD family hydrolase n=1 Tax=Heyndrickxia sporothermodurans TaxID=46224 RepID=UPI0035E25573
MIKAIFFDLDDTLHDHQAPFAKAFMETFKYLKILPAISDSYKKFRYYSDLQWGDYTKGKISLEHLRINRIKSTLESFDITLSEDQAIQFQKAYEHNLNHLTLFSEVPQLFKELTTKGTELGIITNGPVAHQQKKIHQLRLTQMIPNDRIFISDQVGYAKPDPRIFHEVREKINIPAQNLIYVGDTWENDIVGPTNAGWNAIWFNHRNRRRLEILN